MLRGKWGGNGWAEKVENGAGGRYLCSPSFTGAASEMGRVKGTGAFEEESGHCWNDREWFILYFCILKALTCNLHRVKSVLFSVHFCGCWQTDGVMEPLPQWRSRTLHHLQKLRLHTLLPAHSSGYHNPSYWPPAPGKVLHKPWDNFFF